ncbi:glycosyltransferase family 2 protein [Altibacter sp. HG106]|uniref:glycosyltransferase family 2 protein n=1 Tax=Altibacter sp. HG106 TaxID=3023937 RepID=UPI00235101F1|nr:glycosyltransferase family A protein [Altibacter sp. HG106]MDC7996127.1 glycosyltransferase family A protein [Altibacter sp. HG106]
MLSILIPVYNYDVAPLLQRLYQEVIALSEPIEVVLREDGSTEFLTSNATAAETYAVRYSVSESNNGRTQTRQWLAKHATHQNLLFLDADVLPSQPDFIERYLSVAHKKHADVIFGGISYSEVPKKKNHELRWTFGTQREARKAVEREAYPYFIISQNLCIAKALFLKINDFEQEGYGLDNVFSYRLKQQNASVIHIDNTVCHFGLETNTLFLSKSLNAIETLVHYEAAQKIPTNFTRLQQGYTSLRKRGFIWFFLTVFRIFKSTIERNLLSSQPKMSWFDLYRLYHYAKLKRIKRA